MPIPFIIAVLAAGGATAYGVKNAVDAKDTMNRAKRIGQEGEAIVKQAEKKRDNTRKTTNQSLQQLGIKKCDIMSTSMDDFLNVFMQIKNVDFRDSVGMEELRDFTPGSEVVGKLKEETVGALELSTSIAAGAAGGAAAAMGAYGAVGAFAAASTGTAIASLSGAAATNATLAWLGGGTLAAGGFGVAGGTALLGGLIAAPAILVGSFFLSSKADKALSEAKSYHAKAESFRATCNKACKLFGAIATRANQITVLLERLDKKFANRIPDIRDILMQYGTDWRKYSQGAKQNIAETAMLAKTLKVIMDTPLLHEDGTFADEESARVLATYQR